MRREISIPTEKGGPEIVKEGGRFETRNTYVKKRTGAKGYGDEVNNYKKRKKLCGEDLKDKEKGDCMKTYMET